MNALFTRVMERVSRWLFPASGRHRAIAPFAHSVEQYLDIPTLRRRVSTRAEPMYVDDSRLVRPYVLSPEERRTQMHSVRRPLLVCPHLDAACLDGDRA